MISTKATTLLTARGTVIQMLSKLWRIRSAFRWLDSLSQMQLGWMSSRNTQQFGGILIVSYDLSILQFKEKVWGNPPSSISNYFWNICCRPLSMRINANVQ